MKEKIIESLFFISLVSFCIEGCMVITFIGVLVFCCCGIYIIKHEEDFPLEEETTPKRKTIRKKRNKKRYHDAA